MRTAFAKSIADLAWIQDVGAEQATGTGIEHLAPGAHDGDAVARFESFPAPFHLPPIAEP